MLLQGSPLHAIFGALFVSLFLMPPQLKHDHYTLQSWYEVLQLLFTFWKKMPTRENYKNLDTILMNFLSI